MFLDLLQSTGQPVSSLLQQFGYLPSVKSLRDYDNQSVGHGHSKPNMFGSCAFTNRVIGEQQKHSFRQQVLPHQAYGMGASAATGSS